MRERYFLSEKGPVIYTEGGEDGLEWGTYVVLPQFFDIKAFLVQRYKQEPETDK